MLKNNVYLKVPNVRAQCDPKLLPGFCAPRLWVLKWVASWGEKLHLHTPIKMAISKRRKRRRRGRRREKRERKELAGIWGN